MGLSASEQLEMKLLLDQLYNTELAKKSLDIWRKQPEVWLRDRFGEDIRAILWTHYPEYRWHNWDGTKDPFWTAWVNIASGRWVGLESATGVGKTYILARIVYWFLDCYPNALVVTSAPKREQLTLHLWSEISVSFHKFKRIRPYAELTHLKLRVDARSEDTSESWMAVGFVAGVKASEESTTKAQGFHRKKMLIITEETPGMPWPTLNAFINTSVDPENNLILSVGNPDNVTDPLHHFIEKFASRVVPIRVSAYDHPNVVLERDIIPGAVTQGAIDTRKIAYGEESTFFKSRVRGISPKQGKDSLIKYEWIMSCRPGKPEYEKEGEILVNTNSYNAVGVDVANSEAGDMAALAWGKNNFLTELQEFQCPNANHLAYNLIYDDLVLAKKGYNDYAIPTINEMEVMQECVGVDSVGVGSGTVNTFKDENYYVCSLQGGENKEIIPVDENDQEIETDKKKKLFKFQNLRSQMYWLAAQALLRREVAIVFDDEQMFDRLVRELVVIKYVTKAGTISVEKKDDIKKRLGGKSPNLADAFAYWNYMRLGYNVSGGVAMPMR